MQNTLRDIPRCAWVGTDQIYIDYHDTEWGVPEYDPRALWEKLVLDGFQAGLSWITILKKREAFRAAFCNFDPQVIANWGEADVQRLLQNPGIVRHRGKIEATITGARAYLEIDDFSAFMWRYVDGRSVQGNYVTHADVPTQSPLTAQISRDLKSAGFKFCGPTIVYAWMEACGLFNNHTLGCHRHSEVAEMGR
ncbi:MAG: DNA-3-methyladenine glycosylase I [Pseudomonadota bacterium]